MRCPGNRASHLLFGFIFGFFYDFIDTVDHNSRFYVDIFSQNIPLDVGGYF